MEARSSKARKVVSLLNEPKTEREFEDRAFRVATRGDTDQETIKVDDKVFRITTNAPIHFLKSDDD
jgi:hypothetical protein